MEDWRIGGLEHWKIGGQPDWRMGALEDWSILGIGGLGDWRIGRLKFKIELEARSSETHCSVDARASKIAASGLPK